MCLYELICTTYIQEAVETKRGYWILLELELREVVSFIVVIGLQPGFSARVVSFINF